MNILNFIVASSPILVVLFGIMVFKKPAMKVAPLGLVWTMILAFTYFNITDMAFMDNVKVVDALLWKGIKEGLKIVAMVFAAFVILNLLKKTGAIDDVKITISKISDDRRVQLVIIGLMVPIFLEGAAGAGAPAAIAAPFLVALGFDPITSIAVALLGDATPCSWGGAGLTTITGGASLVTSGVSTTFLNSAMVGRVHMFGALIIPFIMVALAFGKKGFKGIIPYLTYAGLTTGGIMFFLSNFIGPEITSLGTGFISIIFSVIYVKLFKINTPDEYRYKFDKNVKQKYSSFRALSPYLYMLVLLPVIRYTVPLKYLTPFGYIVWVDCVIFICAVFGAMTLKVSRHDFGQVCSDTIKGVMPVLVTMGSLLVVSYIMQSKTTGMMTLVAGGISGVAKSAYPAAAVLIGSMGSFITGTGLGSNIMFADMHVAASQSLSMNPITVFAGQNAGASLGNLICPNNTVAACATVGAIGKESEVMKKTVISFAVVLCVYMTLTMLYTLVIFPNYGL